MGRPAPSPSPAAANGATLVNWYQASICHGACKSSSNRWVEPLVPGELGAVPPR
jgi:hypothetical protein